jgi:TonB family protein
MSHGIEAYFDERRANARRVALARIGCSLLAALVMLALSWRLRGPDDLGPERFGFEGPRQWVERIRLEEIADRDEAGESIVTYLTAESRRGSPERDRSSHPNAEVQPRRDPGQGDAVADLLARARLLAREAPVVRSEDLVIERLVRPEYPTTARDRDLEGVVEMIALVDTTGDVLECQVVGGTREPLFEHAAAKAVLACRYRPYRVADQARRVWAAYRIAFSLY